MSRIEQRIVEMTRPRRAKWFLPLGVTACYVLFAAAVHLRLLDPLDVAVGDASRPGDVWGPVQVRASRVVTALEPEHLAPPLVLLVAAVALLRRSLRPFLVTAVVGVPVAIATLGSKWLMARSDAGTMPVNHGSFPSGHTVAVIMAFGMAVLLLRPATRWGWMLPAGMGCLMGSALILAWVHPATDVIGAGLLAGGALTGARAAGVGRWASERQRRGLG